MAIFLLHNTTQRLLQNASDDILINASEPAELYRLYTESDYNETTKTTQSGQAQAWDGLSKLGGLFGDMNISLAGGTTNTVFVTHSGLYIGDSTSLAIRLYFDSADIEQSDGDVLGLLSLYDSAITLGFGLSQLGSQSRIMFAVAPDTGGLNLDYVNIDAGQHYVDIVAFKSDTDSSNNGSVDYYVDGNLEAQRTSLDFYSTFSGLANIEVGPGLTLSGPDVGTSGDVWIGKILITNDANPIGPFLSYRHRPRPAAIIKKRQRIKGHRCG